MSCQARPDSSDGLIPADLSSAEFASRSGIDLDRQDRQINGHARIVEERGVKLLSRVTRCR